MVPYFLPLARLDDQHYITACRHGLVHLTWGRTTTRFSRAEFQKLAGLVAEALGPYPTTIRDGDLRITFSPEGDCEVQVGPLVVVLSSAEFAKFARLLPEAAQQLAKILASRVWERDEQEAGPGDLLSQLRRTLFSQN
jgi:hypothetical protein